MIAARVRELIKHREILYRIAWRDVVVKYKQSIMGFLWAILMPMVIVGAGVIVRTGLAYIAGRDLAISDVASVALKSVPWAFAVASIRFATNSLSSNASLITKIFVPREIFPLAAILSQFVDFCMASAPLTVLLAIAGVGISWQLLWVPVIVAILILLVAAFGILLSAASLFFRDVKYIVEILLTFAIFGTPVLYDVDMFRDWRNLLLLNPIAPLLEALNSTVILHRAPEFAWVGYSAGVAAVAMILAVALFTRLEPYFAESV